MIAQLAIFASGSGTTAEAIIRACAHGVLHAKPRLLICNNANAYVIERLHRLNDELGTDVHIAVINHHTHPDPTSTKPLHGQQSVHEEQAILGRLRAENISLVVLAGYLKKVGPLLVHAFGWRNGYTSPYQAAMLNTHPGLLPATKGEFGIHIQQSIIRNKQSEAGQTLHVVADDYDTGPIIAEHRTAVMPDDTPETLFDRVQQIEKQHIATDIQMFWTAKVAFQHNQEDGV